MMTPAEFKTIRERLGLTPKELAERIGYARDTIHRIERGAIPITRRLVLLMRTL